MAGTGGKREGAGRPKGAAHKRNQEVLEKALSVGITPLEVMLMAMKDALDKGELKDASNFAKDAAPYCHAKLQATTIKGDSENPLVIASKEQRDAVVAAAYALNNAD